MNLKIVFIVLLLVLSGCSTNESKEVLTDEDTTAKIATVESESALTTYQHMNDNMDRGNHDYSAEPLAVDTELANLTFTRGDVVLFENEKGDKSVSRIIALPNEKVKIEKGQLFIDGKKLETFYGVAQRAGLDKETYFAKMDEEKRDYNKESAAEVFEMNMAEVKLAGDEYYLADDDWFRGTREIAAENQLIGKVMGYSK